MLSAALTLFFITELQIIVFFLILPVLLWVKFNTSYSDSTTTFDTLLYMSVYFSFIISYKNSTPWAVIILY